VTLDDWTKLLDVALRETQHTCVTLTDVPDTAQELRALVEVAHEKATSAGLHLSKVEVPLARYAEAADLPAAVGAATDVVRLTFSASAPMTHGRRIVLLQRDPPQPLARPARFTCARGSARRVVSQRRARDQGSLRPSAHR
jgi:hypothetical protein